MTTIKIPRFLQDLHGKETSLFSLIAIYLMGLIVAFVVDFQMMSVVDLSTWKIIVVFVLAFDIGGGVIANYTDSTRKYYEENKRKHTIFIFLHILHGTFFALIFMDQWVLFSFMSIYAVLSCLLLASVRNKENNRIFSALLFTIGILIIFLIPCPIEVLRVIPILFFTKLILAFSTQ